MVRVIDAIMGTGKSTAAINYINEHCEHKRFMYVTEYLPEASRIAQACPQANMQEPDENTVAGNSKTAHLRELVAAGHNISCSHVLFKWCPQDILDNIKEQGYIIIIDEVMNIFEDVGVSVGDMEWMLEREALITTVLDEDGDVLRYDLNPDSDYKGVAFRSFFTKIGRQPIIQIREKSARKNAKAQLHTRQWLLPKQLFEASDEIYILTYMFDGTPLSAFLEINNIPVEHWCVTMGENGLTFGNSNPYIPPYVYSVKDKIHICRNAKRNEIGDPETALSVNWYKRERKKSSKDKLDELRSNIRWFMRDDKNVPKHHSSERMWTCFHEGYNHLVDKGFTNADVTFNKRATNKYRDRKVLAYCANIFAIPGLLKYCQAYGLTYNEEEYALSTLVQWIWRSAIRDGEEIWLYLPSSRMRRFLDHWLDDISSGIVTGFQKHNI